MQTEDFNWFVENCEHLFEQYGRCFLAIHNKTVVGAFENARVAIATTKESIPLGEFIVQLCTGEESGYTNYISSMHFTD